MIATKIVQYISLPVSTAVLSMLDKLLLTSITDGITIKITIESTHVMKIVCKNILQDFLNTVSVTIIDKPEPSNPLEREEY